MAFKKVLQCKRSTFWSFNHLIEVLRGQSRQISDISSKHLKRKNNQQRPIQEVVLEMKWLNHS